MDGAPALQPPGRLPCEVADDPDLLAVLLESAPAGVACFDLQARLLYVNQRWAAASGLSGADQHGRMAREVLPGMADALDAQVRTVLATGRPLEAVDVSGVLRGVLCHWSTSWHPLRDPGTGQLRGVAVVAADVTGQVGAAESLRHTALMLQRSLLPSTTPSTEELEVAVRYDAGVADSEVGGDWYDVVPLGGGRLALIIGDVMGRGVQAAAVMGQLRTAVRTCARLDLRPFEVVELLDSLVADLGDGGHIATCIYAVFDPHTRELLLASAGHLPPVVRTPTGHAHRLDVEVSAPLGVGDAPRQSRVRMDPGTVLALFTDGLVAVRGSDLDTGLDALCRVLAAGPDDLEELADAVLHRLSTDDADDDVALLLVRVPPDVDSRSRTVVLHLPRERAQLAEVRGRARAAMLGWSLLDDLVHAGTLLVSELATNALVHGKGQVELRLRLTRDRLVVECEDGGHHLPRRRQAGVDDEGGRGLLLVSALSDRWGARLTDDGKVVWAEVSLA